MEIATEDKIGLPKSYFHLIEPSDRVIQFIIPLWVPMKIELVDGIKQGVALILPSNFVFQCKLPSISKL